MARLVAVGVLTYHTRTEERQFGIGSRSIREQAVEFVGKALLAYKSLKSLYVVLYRPHIVPAIRLADMRRIIIGRVVGLKVTLRITRLHECRTRTINVAIVLSTLCKSFSYVLLAQMLCKGSNTSIIVSVFQSARQRPVISQCRLLHIVRHIAKTLVQSYSTIVIKVGSLDTLGKSFTCFNTRNTLQYRLGNDRCSMIAYHHVCLRCPHIPNRQSSVLLAECNKRLPYMFRQHR